MDHNTFFSQSPSSLNHPPLDSYQEVKNDIKFMKQMLSQNIKEMNTLRQRLEFRLSKDNANHHFHFEDQHDQREIFDAYHHNQLDLRMPHESH